jgi:uncharacterized protein YkwD
MRAALMRDGVVFALALSLAFAACASSVATPTQVTAPVAAPKGLLNLEQARRYVLKLVNHDRAEFGLSPVTLDDAATRAGQRHADDMAKAGYTAHWGTDGSVPEQRYSEAGGTDFVQENAGCVADGKARTLEPSPHFKAEQLERVEHAFMDEKPPHDGHRKNILKRTHSALGVGVAKPSAVDLACLSQEFVDDYGEYGALPQAARAGTTLHIEGDVKGNVAFGGVGVGRIDPAKPLTASYLNTTYVYAVPSPEDLYFPKGFVSKKPVEVSGKHFKIDVPLGNAGRAGRYEVSVWGKFPGSGDQLDIVSLRVVTAK